MADFKTCADCPYPGKCVELESVCVLRSRIRQWARQSLKAATVSNANNSIYRY